MLDFMKKMLGNKSQRDIKVINPIVAKTLVAYEAIKQLSNDGLREKTLDFRKRIKDFLSDKEKEIEEMKARINSEDIEIDEKEKLYTDLDRL